MRFRRAGVGALVAVSLAVGLVLAGCGASTTSPAASGPSASPTIPIPFYSPGPPSAPEPAADVYARIEAQVQQMRGLQAKNPVEPKVLDAPALERALRERFDRDNPPAIVAATQRLYELTGLVPSGTSLKELYLKLLTSQVAGFYDPNEKSLFVVSRAGGLGPSEQVTFAHEFTHALQDQNFGLKKLGTSIPDQSDRSAARLSLAEGDATLLMSDWSAANLTPVQLLQLLQVSADPVQTQVLNAMPAILRDQLLFPYTSGLAFVEGQRNSGGWSAIDAVYGRPPDSTEQILHPEKYLAHETPVAVEMPVDLAKRLGAGWRVDLQDTWGEFGLREWLSDAGGIAAEQANAAGQGWGGDRLVLVSNGSTMGVAIETVWDTTADAAEFATAARVSLSALDAETALVDAGSTNRVTIFIATSKATIGRLAGALGIAQ